MQGDGRKRAGYMGKGECYEGPRRAEPCVGDRWWYESQSPNTAVTWGGGSRDALGCLLLGAGTCLLALRPPRLTPPSCRQVLEPLRPRAVTLDGVTRDSESGSKLINNCAEVGAEAGRGVRCVCGGGGGGGGGGL